jgi:hypothetical protein
MVEKAVVLALLVSVAAAARTIDFSRVPIGALPPGWVSAMTHEGEPPKWEVVADSDGRRVLAQTSTGPTSGRFPVCVYRPVSLRDGRVRVRFKPVAGERDQAAGIVWRYTDPDNYYIVRANALENNIVLYKVEKGQRISLAPKNTPSKTYGVQCEVPARRWSALEVSFRESTFDVSFDGRKVMTVEDSTFLGAGKTGVWTKADSVVYFSDFVAARR